MKVLNVDMKAQGYDLFLVDAANPWLGFGFNDLKVDPTTGRLDYNYSVVLGKQSEGREAELDGLDFDTLADTLIKSELDNVINDLSLGEEPSLKEETDA